MTSIEMQYKHGEITREEANAKLKEQGAGFHFEHLTDEERKAKLAREQAESTVPGSADPDAKKGLQQPDLSRRTDKKNSEDVQYTTGGVFKVFYDANGYAYKATRVQED